MNINFKHFTTKEECREAFFKMVHAKEEWETRMQSVMSNSKLVNA